MAKTLQQATLRRRANAATVAEAAEITGVDLQQLYGAVMRGVVPSRKSPTGKGGKLIVVDLDDVEAWHAGQGVSLEYHEVLHFTSMGFTPPQIADLLGMKRLSLYRLLRRHVRAVSFEIPGLDCPAYKCAARCRDSNLGAFSEESGRPGA